MKPEQLLWPVIVLSMTFSISGANPPDSRLQVERRASAARLILSNAANQVWTIQGSFDLITWTNVAVWKVHNGLFGTNLSAGPNQPHFFRAFYDPEQQSVLSTTTNALLLPGTPFNYAAPVLPPSFSVQPIPAQDNMPLNNVTTDAARPSGAFCSTTNAFRPTRLSAAHPAIISSMAFPIRASSALGSTAS